MNDLITKTESINEVCIDVEALSRSKQIQNIEFSMQEELSALPPELYTVCIYRVSENYKKPQKDPYTPHKVSIGPLHHGKSHLQAFEVYKVKYLQNFIYRFGISLGKLISYAANMEVAVRSCYEDTSMFNFREFCRMILLDGIFVVELFLNNLIKIGKPGDILIENLSMASDLMLDMLLLENQLPLMFLSGLLELVDGTEVHQRSFHELSCDYFSGIRSTKRLNLIAGYEHARHLVEFLYILHIPHYTYKRETEKVRNGRLGYTRSASELQAAGVCFGIEMGDLFEVSFDCGLLKLPQLTVYDKITETFFRNLIAYEQRGHDEKVMTSYVIFMATLINKAEDVELLVKHGIINNFLGESQLVADIFNNLDKEVKERPYDFSIICNDLDSYYKDCVHKWKYAWYKWKIMRWLGWKSILINKYFSNPWAAIGVIAASVVVVCTVLQTVGSYIAL